MKKWICTLLCVLMLLSLCACGGAKPVGTGAPPAAASEAPAQAEQPAAAWTRSGYFMDENENMISVIWMDDIDEPGWYVGVMLGEGYLPAARRISPSPYRKKAKTASFSQSKAGRPTISPPWEI